MANKRRPSLVRARNDGDDRAVRLPKLPAFQQATLKALRWEDQDQRVVIKDAGMVT